MHGMLILLWIETWPRPHLTVILLSTPTDNEKEEMLDAGLWAMFILEILAEALY